MGIFQPYALGNLYAAQFFEQAREDVGDLNAQFAEGNFEPLKNWLTDKIYSQGQRYRAGDLVEVVTKKPLTHAPSNAALARKVRIAVWDLEMGTHGRLGTGTHGWRSGAAVGRWVDLASYFLPLTWG